MIDMIQRQWKAQHSFCIHQRLLVKYYKWCKNNTRNEYLNNTWIWVIDE